LRSIIVRLTSLEAGSFFFQPFQLHPEPSDLLVQLGLTHLLLVLLTRGAAAEDDDPFFLELLFPAAHQIRVQVVLASDLANRLQSPGGFERHPELELRVVLSTSSTHFHASTSCSDSIEIHLSLWSHFRGSSYSWLSIDC
jgi:hypothetical protein